LPYLKPTAGLSQWVAADVAAHTPPRALIIVAVVGDDAQCEVDVPYFAHRPVLSLHGTLAHAKTYSDTQATLCTTLDKAFGAGRSVYVLDELWTNRRTVAALHHQNPEIDAPLVQSLFDEYQLVPSWHGPRGWVWKLTPPSRLGKSGRIKGGARRTTRVNEFTFRRPSEIPPGPPGSA